MAASSASDSSSDVDGDDDDPFQQHLQQIEQWLAGGQPAHWNLAAEAVERLQQGLESTDVAAEELLKRRLALATARGHVERLRGNCQAALAAYRDALEMLAAGDYTREQRLMREANLWTCCGLAGLAGETAAEWSAALHSFDKSNALRDEIESPGQEVLWGQSAAWINRGEALEKLGGEENIRDAVLANQRAAECLAKFDLDQVPAFRSRMALTWMNRGELLATITEQGWADEAGQCQSAYAKAVEILRAGSNAGAVESRRLLAVCLANSSRSHLRLGDFGKAGVDQAREGLELILQERAGNADDPALLHLEMTLRATLCRTMALAADAGTAGVDCDQVTDEVETALEVATGAGELAGVIPVPLIAELFGCGAEVYARFQPEFLAEYLLEYLDPASQPPGALCRIEGCHAVAVSVLWREIGRFQKEGFAAAGSAEYDRRLSLLEDFQRCRTRLGEVREDLGLEGN